MPSGSRYVRVSPYPFRFCLLSLGGGGKTHLALAPHPALGVAPKSVAYLAMDDGAELLEGIPPAFVENGRLLVVKPGFDRNGDVVRGTEKRPQDPALYTESLPTFTWKVIDWVSERRPGIKTIIVDTVNAFSELTRDLDDSLDGRKSYHKAQLATVALYRRLYMANRHANIILLHHRAERSHKEKDKSGNDIDIFESYVPATVGKALHETWPGKFTGVFKLGCEVERKVDPKTGNVVRDHAFRLHLRPTDDCDVVKLRAASTERVPAAIDITYRDGNYEPLLKAWDTILRLTDSSTAARVAMSDAAKPAGVTTPAEKEDTSVG